ncbi:MAG: hypothetical protein ACYDEN_09595, partial [Acidimicrobiales bacterium]
FAVGDRVIPLRREAGPAGAEGRVVAAVAGPVPRLEVRWDGERRTVDAWAARGVGHAYALTPAGLRLRGGPALLLGDPAALGREAAHVVVALRAGAPRPALDRSDLALDRSDPALDLGRGPGREQARDGPGLGLGLGR